MNFTVRLFTIECIAAASLRYVVSRSPCIGLANILSFSSNLLQIVTHLALKQYCTNIMSLRR